MIRPLHLALALPLMACNGAAAPPPAEAHPTPAEANPTPAEVDPPPGLSAADAKTLAEAIRGAEPAKRSLQACTTIAEIERDRLPTFLATALRDYGTLPLDRRAMAIATHVDSAEGRTAWKAACSGGLDVLDKLVDVPADEQNLLLWEKCEMSRFALFDLETVKAADSLAIMLAILTANALTRGNTLLGDEAFAISQVIATPKALLYAEPATGSEEPALSDEGLSPTSL